METKAARRERVIRAAIEWVYDGCLNAQMELDAAVEELVGKPVERDND